jgi:hypothetical protein
LAPVKKPLGKAIILQPATYSELNHLKLEYSYMSRETRTFDDVVRYLIDFMTTKVEEIEAEKAQA